MFSGTAPRASAVLMREGSPGSSPTFRDLQSGEGAGQQGFLGEAAFEPCPEGQGGEAVADGPEWAGLACLQRDSG